jgi:hypothetical protein
VASAYILSCAPLLVRGERATQWRGGIAEGTPAADSQKLEAVSQQPAVKSIILFTIESSNIYKKRKLINE